MTLLPQSNDIKYWFNLIKFTKDFLNYLILPIVIIFLSFLIFCNSQISPVFLFLWTLIGKWITYFWDKWDLLIQISVLTSKLSVPTPLSLSYFFFYFSYIPNLLFSKFRVLFPYMFFIHAHYKFVLPSIHAIYSLFSHFPYILNISFLPYFSLWAYVTERGNTGLYKAPKAIRVKTKLSVSLFVCLWISHLLRCCRT